MVIGNIHRVPPKILEYLQMRNNGTVEKGQVYTGIREEQTLEKFGGTRTFWKSKTLQQKPGYPEILDYHAILENRTFEEFRGTWKFKICMTFWEKMDIRQIWPHTRSHIRPTVVVILMPTFINPNFRIGQFYAPAREISSPI